MDLSMYSNTCGGEDEAALFHCAALHSEMQLQRHLH